MSSPPFRPALLQAAPLRVACCAGAEATPATRLRLGDMDAHLHCSVIGTCLTTADLHKLMAHFIDVAGLPELDVHHEAVRLASQSAEVARALHKALDRRHAGALQRFAKASDDAAVTALWEQSLASGEVPGAYWAVLTHRRSTPWLRQRVFGDVHMLSHLVGAANRTDIRRLVALERENADWRERSERQQERLAGFAAERERDAAERAHLQAQLDACRREHRHAIDAAAGSAPAADPANGAAPQIALQTQRREAAEAALQAQEAEAVRLADELDHLKRHVDVLARELAAAEAQLRAAARTEDGGSAAGLRETLAGRHLLYVGGRPSSNAAIRDLVLRIGADYRRHDGGIEDRKGLLASLLAWADLVVFPVDCIDHDSALALKRACVRLGKPFVPLRSAGVASLVAGLMALREECAAEVAHRNGPCLRHG